MKKYYKDDIKLHGERQVEKKTVFLGSQSLRAGHRCFEINTDTMGVSEAQYERIVGFNTPDTISVIVKQNCVYVNALNRANALKVYNKGGRIEIKPFMSL